MFAQLINRIHRTELAEADGQRVGAASASTALPGSRSGDRLFAALDDHVTPDQRALIHLAIDWIDTPLAFFDAQLALQCANAAYATLVGRERDALIGLSIDDVGCEQGAGIARQCAARALGGEDVAAQVERGIEASYRPQRQPDGQVIGVVCTLERTTARVHQPEVSRPSGDVGAAVNESEARFRAFAENVTDSIVFIDREGRFGYVNEAFLRRGNRVRADVEGRTIEEVFGAAVLDRSRAFLTRAFSGETFTWSGRSMLHGASEWREVRMLPMRDGSGVVCGVHILSRCIEAAVEAEQRAQRAVRERDERIHFLTDNLPAQILYVDPEMRLQYCNQRFLDDYGFESMEAVAGQTPEALLGEELMASAVKHAPAVLAGARVTYERRLSADPADGRWLRVALAGDFGEDGRVRGMYSIAYDVTDSKLAEGARAREQAWIEAFIENFPQPLGYLDQAGVHRFANRAYETLAGRPKTEIVGRSGVAVFGVDVARKFNATWRQALGGVRLHTEQSVPGDANPDRVLAVDWMPDVDDHGVVQGVYCVMQDVSETKRAHHAYEESLREMQRAMDSVALPISFVDTLEHLRFVNHATTTWHGRSAVELIGTPLCELMSDDDYRFAQPYIRAALAGESVQYEREMRYHDGIRRWVLIRYVATRDEHEAVTGFYTTATDIQSRKKHEIALQQANGLLTAHFENTPLASFTLDAGRRVTRWSSQAETLFGWRRDEVLDRSFEALELTTHDIAHDFLPHDDDPDTAVGNTRLHVVETRRRDGSRVTGEWHIAALRDASGRIASTLALVQDVSQRVEAERRLTEIAHRDTLTRLLNRNALEPTLRSFIEHARQDGTGVAVLFLDLDHFKNINDTLGHRVGDLMLIEVATILRNSVRAEDEVARIGGDEFMVVIGHRQPKAIAHETAQRILAALGTPIRVDNQRLSVTSSIGIAIYPDHGRAPDALIRSADLAMYRAKENGKNRFEFFSAMLAQRSERRSAVKSALKVALQREALRLYFQPRVRIRDNLIVGAETLLRWTDPRLGVVSPKEFIVIAEESGLIHELGLYVFRKACRQLRDWQDRGIAPGILSVNFSAHQLLVATFIDEVDTVIEESGVDPRSIEVEITETSMLFDLGVTRDVIADLKQRGMHIAIDDFGTGFSSLSHLQQLDVDTLKIDQSFIRDMLHDSGDAAITTSVISMARGLGLSTTAEGVENERQLEALRDAGCDYYQGFLFSPAIVVEDIEQLLANQGGAAEETPVRS